VGAVQFDAVEAGAIGTARRGDERVDRPLHLVVRHRLRAGFRVVRRALRRAADECEWRPHPGVVQLRDGM
jgi:hypothetical protein